MVAVFARWVLLKLSKKGPPGYKRVIRIEKCDGSVLTYEADEDEIVSRSEVKKILRWMDTLHDSEEPVCNFSFSLVPKDEVADVEHLEDTNDPGALPPSR